MDEPDALGSPHHGAGRLALESGAPIVPAAVAGTHHLWLGPILKPRRVRVAFGTPIEASELGDSPAALTELIDGRVWPAVAAEYGRLRAAPGLVAAALAAVGMGALVVRRQRQQARPRLLGIVEAKKLRRRKARSRLANDPCGGPPPHLDEGRGRWESVPMAHPDVCSAQVRYGLILRLTEIVRPGHALGIDVSGAA